MNAVFSSRSTGEGGISPVSAPGVCITANISAIAWHPPLWTEGWCTRTAKHPPSDRHVAVEGGVGQTAVAAYVTTYGASTGRPGSGAPSRAPPDPALPKGFRASQPARADVDNPPHRLVGCGRPEGGASAAALGGGPRPTADPTGK